MRDGAWYLVYSWSLSSWHLVCWMGQQEGGREPRRAWFDYGLRQCQENVNHSLSHLLRLIKAEVLDIMCLESRLNAHFLPTPV